MIYINWSDLLFKLNELPNKIDQNSTSKSAYPNLLFSFSKLIFNEIMFINEH